MDQIAITQKIGHSQPTRRSTSTPMLSVSSKSSRTFSPTPRNSPRLGELYMCA